MTELTCFKAYDILGKLGAELNDTSPTASAALTPSIIEGRLVIIDSDMHHLSIQQFK